MIADSVPIDGFNGSLGVVGVKLAALAGFFRWFAQGLAVEGEAVRSMHETVEDGVGNGRIDDHLVPVIDGELTGCVPGGCLSTRRVQNAKRSLGRSTRGSRHGSYSSTYSGIALSP